MDNVDLYFKKTVGYRYGEYDLTFKVSQDLFSSDKIDSGTQRLLRSLSSENDINYRKVLDLGCGYGPIGISLKAVNTGSEVHMVDRDALALEYSKANAELNNVGAVKVYGSLGYDALKESDFDWIVSNVPAKVGKSVLTHMIMDARYYLRVGGKVAVVVVDEIAEHVAKDLAKDEINILFHRSWSGHHVYHYEFAKDVNAHKGRKQFSFDSGNYLRNINSFSFNNNQYKVHTTFYLPEFDTLSYNSQLLLANLSKVDISREKNLSTLVFDPGQGYIPLALTNIFNISSLQLVSRDLQALKISKKNLENNNFPIDKLSIYHQVGIECGDKKDLIVCNLQEKHNLKVYHSIVDQISSSLNNKGNAVLVSSSTIITRIAKYVESNSKFKIKHRDRSKKQSTLILELID